VSSSEAISVSEGEVLAFLKDVADINGVKVSNGISQAIILDENDWPGVKLKEVLEIAGKWGYVGLFCEQADEGVWNIQWKPSFIRWYKDQKKEVHRQATIEGKKIDLRNGVNQEILTARINDLAEITVPCWIRNLDDPEPRVRHASQTRLQKVAMLRGEELETAYPQVWSEIKRVLAQ